MDDLDLAELNRLVGQLLAGKQTAWPALVGVLFPALEKFVGGSRAMGPLRQSADHRRTVATDVLERLARNDYRSLGSLGDWLDANPGRTAADWLRIVATNAVRDHVERQLGGRAAERKPDEPSSGKRLLHTLAEGLPERDDDLRGFRPAVTNQQAARTILDAARELLSAQQAEVLDLWLRGVDAAEIAQTAGLEDGAAAARLVRAALARLRHRFA